MSLVYLVCTSTSLTVSFVCSEKMRTFCIQRQVCVWAINSNNMSKKKKRVQNNGIVQHILLFKLHHELPRLLLVGDICSLCLVFSTMYYSLSVHNCEFQKKPLLLTPKPKFTVHVFK